MNLKKRFMKRFGTSSVLYDRMQPDYNYRVHLNNNSLQSAFQALERKLKTQIDTWMNKPTFRVKYW